MATATSKQTARPATNDNDDNDNDNNDPELTTVFAAGEKFEERERRTRAAVVLESDEEVLVWWAMERDETIPQTRLFFERQLSGYHNPDTSFLTSTNNLRHSPSIEIDNEMNDIIDIDDNYGGHSQKNKSVDTYATQGSSPKSSEIDDERLYEDLTSKSLSASGATAKKQPKQKQRLNDLDDEMSEDEDGGGVGIGENRSALAGASAGSSREGP